MKIIKIPLLIALFIIATGFSWATTPMLNNPFNLNDENKVTEHFSAAIQQFWQKNAQSNYFLGIDNKKIHTISIVTGNNKVIVISQGRKESVFKYKELTYELSQLGYDIFLIDHRGQGLSERLGGDQYRGHVDNFQDYVSDINQFVTSLQLSKHYSERYLLSHSMGGAISALYLEQYPTPFQAAVFFSPMLSINLSGLPIWLAKTITTSSAEVCSWFSDKACYAPAGSAYQKAQFAGNALTSSQPRFIASQYDFEQYPATQLGSATMQWVSTSLSAAQQAVQQAGNIKIPIMVVQAGNDTIVSDDGQKTFFDNVTFCKANQYLKIAGAKHEILLESDQYRVPALSAALQFLSDLQEGKRTCTK